MPDYKEMYFHLFRATEKAINILIQAQQSCEEIYMDATETEIVIFPSAPEQQSKEETPKRPL